MFSVTTLIVFSAIGLFSLSWTAAMYAGWDGRIGVSIVLLLEGLVALSIGMYAIDSERFMLGLAQLVSQ